VHIDYHVEVDGHYYSVPYALVGKQCQARVVTATTVEIFHKSKRVASHARSNRRGQHTTVNEHMPEKHRQHGEWTPELVRWAAKNREATGKVVHMIMASKPHPHHGYRPCLGIMRLGKKHGPSRLEAACKRALALNAISYKSIKSILDSGLENRPLPKRNDNQRAPISHGNIRGADYYASQGNQEKA
jgi:transposase